MMGGMRGILELVLGWLRVPAPPVPACLTASHRPLTVLALTDAALTTLALSHAPLTVLTLTDERCD